MPKTPKGKNGLRLRLQEIQTSAEKVQFVSDIHAEIAKHFTQDSILTFVAYMANQVVIDRYTPYAAFDQKFVQRLRVFNEQEELLLWRSGGTLKGRMRHDYPKNSTQGKGVNIVEADQVLFGTKIDRDFRADGYTKITEDRGTSLIVPFNNLESNEKGELLKRLCVKTYNYICYNEAHQATYSDCRFVRFFQHPGQLLQQGGQVE